MLKEEERIFESIAEKKGKISYSYDHPMHSCSLIRNFVVYLQVHCIV